MGFVARGYDNYYEELSKVDALRSFIRKYNPCLKGMRYMLQYDTLKEAINNASRENLIWALETVLIHHGEL